MSGVELESKNSRGSGNLRKASTANRSCFRDLIPNLRFLRHLMRNPCNSRVHERDKWLLACIAARGSVDMKTALFERINTLLDTQSLVTTFIAGFSFLVISSDLTFAEELIPLRAIVALLGFSFVLSVATTLVSVSIKTHITEIGYEKLYTFFAKYSGLMSLLAHLIIQSIATFMASGLMIMFNKFGLLVGIIMVCIVGAVFLFLALLNLELRDRSMMVLGFDFVGGEYTLPNEISVWLHDDRVAELYGSKKRDEIDANLAMFLSRNVIREDEVELLRDENMV